ncbi:MAG: hypothetical protein WBV48_19585, partial [Candidatus Acidiferrales bacterium]
MPRSEEASSLVVTKEVGIEPDYFVVGVVWVGGAVVFCGVAAAGLAADAGAETAGAVAAGVA